MSTQAGKARDQVLPEEGLNLEELPLVKHTTDDIVHVVGGCRGVGHDGLQLTVHTVGGILGGYDRGLLAIVGGQI